VYFAFWGFNQEQKPSQFIAHPHASRSSEQDLTILAPEAYFAFVMPHSLGAS
jgi:hypothetical protein